MEQVKERVVEKIKQPEGLCLMWYRCKDCKDKERLWNSRPRVTPMFITCSKCKGQMSHIHWNSDEYAPNHQPKSGERVFVDFSKEAAEKLNKEKVEEYWDHSDYPLSKWHSSKEDALKSFMKEWKFGEPSVEIIP